MIILLFFVLVFLIAGHFPLSASSSTNEFVSIENAHCYPNPFKNEKQIAKIKFIVKSDIQNDDSTVSVIIFDFNGKKVWTKSLGQMNIPPNTEFVVKWGGENDLGDKVANGLYFCKIIVEANNTIYKVIKILVK